jgi:hypothetical protein
MTLTTLGLWLVLVGLIAIVPIGCVMTRQKKSGEPQQGTPA